MRKIGHFGFMQVRRNAQGCRGGNHAKLVCWTCELMNPPKIFVCIRIARLHFHNSTRNLNWKPHINYIKKKLCLSAGILVKARKYLPSNCLKTLYYTFVYTYLTYCIHIWGKAYQTHLTSRVIFDSMHCAKWNTQIGLM